MCQGCTTACGVIATVKDGRLLSTTGNPEDPNNRGSVCAKGVAGSRDSSHYPRVRRRGTTLYDHLQSRQPHTLERVLQ